MLGIFFEDIYICFNIDYLKDFKGYSFFVFDVVVFYQNGQDIVYYVDSFGYKEVLEFFKEQEKVFIFDELEIGEIIKMLRGIFYVIVMSCV